METLIDLLKAIQLNMLEAGIAGLFVFLLGFQIGLTKVKKLTHQIYGLQKEVLDLNEELLFGNQEDVSGTPVIGLKQTKLAK